MAANRQIPTSASSPPQSGDTVLDAIQEELTSLFNAGVFPLSSIAGTANAVTANVTPPLTGALQNGMGFLFRPASTNTDAMTMAIDGLSAVDLVDRHGNAMTPGLIIANSVYLLIYNGTLGDLVAITVEPGLVGRQEKYFSVASGDIYTRTTSGAAAGTTETTTNKVMQKTLDFDASAIEYAQFQFRAPKRWNEGTMTAIFVWSHAATTTNFKVSWAIQGLARSNDDALDTAFGTAVISNDTGGTTDDSYESPETSAFTLSGTPAAGDLLTFQVYRVATDATNDTLAVDARLLGVHLFWTADSAGEAA